MNTSDQELLRRTGLGDATAFESLVRRWEAPVGRILSRLVTNASEVDDLRQEAFVRVLLASRRYEPTFAFSTWLYRIVLNLARDAARRHRRTIETLDNCQPIDGDGDPGSAAVRRETAELVESALTALPDHLREVLGMDPAAQ